MVVVTRHQAFVALAQKRGLVDESSVVVAHASEEALRDQDVLSSGLPLHLAALCRTVTTVPLDLPAELRGRELTLEECERYAGPTTRYQVTVV